MDLDPQGLAGQSYIAVLERKVRQLEKENQVLREHKTDAAKYKRDLSALQKQLEKEAADLKKIEEIREEKDLLAREFFNKSERLKQLEEENLMLKATLKSAQTKVQGFSAKAAELSQLRKV